MSEIDRFKLRTIFASSAMAMLLRLSLAGDARAQGCTDYVVTGTSSANWNDTSTLWSPSGTYPGQLSNCDTASDTTNSAKTITVTGAIPNPIKALNLSCTVPGCIIDIPAGGSLTLSGTGTIGSGSILRVSGGTLTIESGGDLTFQSGAQFQFTGGTIDI